MNRLLLGYSPDLDIYDEAAPTLGAARAATRFERTMVSLQGGVAERAAELLEVAGALGVTPLLARVIRGAALAAGRTLPPTLERELTRLLERAAQQALPRLHAASRDARAHASRYFGVELEGLSPEDQEFEIARRFVQFVEASARQALLTPPHLPLARAAQLAVARAAKHHAPGWLAARADAATRTTAPPIRTGHHPGLVPIPLQGADHA